MAQRRNNVFNQVAPAGLADILRSMDPATANTIAYTADLAQAIRTTDLDTEMVWESQRDAQGRFAGSSIRRIERDLNDRNIVTSFAGDKEIVTEKHDVFPPDDGTPTIYPHGSICFTLKQVPVRRNGHYDATLQHLQELMFEQWRHHQSAKNSGTGNYDSTHENYARFSQKYGEDTLWEYQHYRLGGKDFAKYKNNVKQTAPDAYFGDEADAIRQYWEMSTRNEFCYLTLLGCLSRFSPIGAALNDQMLQAPQSEDFRNKSGLAGDRINVVFAVKKNGDLRNCFDTNLKTGTKLIVILRRHYNPVEKTYEYFELVPKAIHDFVESDLYYEDEKGIPQRGYAWYLGRVLQPPEETVSQAQLDYGNNLTMHKSTAQAYESFLQLPEIRVGLGY